MTAPTPLRAGDPARLGAYDLTARIGEGGQGSVFLGISPSGEQVAVKLLRRALIRPEAPAVPDGAETGRFLRETEILRRVAPFCTAQVIETGTLGAQPYIVSEYIEGPTLQEVVQEEGPLRNARLQRLAVGTMTALAAIHRAGVVHRDFKPSNVLLGRDGPRVIDFGIARELDASATGSGVVGTPPYMSPEQLESSSVERPADLFAWASTMVFAATGRPPFGADSLPAIVNRILHKDPELADLDGDLRDLVADCLSKDPVRRPTARDALLRLLGAKGHPPGADLLSAGTALASGTPDHREDAIAGGTPSSVSAPIPVPGIPSTVFEATTVPADGAARRPSIAILAGGAAVLALISAAVVYGLSRYAGETTTTVTGSPGITTGSPGTVAEVTTAPAPVATSFRLPGLKSTLHENPADPVRLTAFMHITRGASNSYEREPASGRFTSSGPFQEALVSPDGKWTAILPWLKDSIPRAYDFVRLVERSTGREFVVSLTDKRLRNYHPQWSSDSRKLLLTSFDESSGVRKPVGFAIVDAAAAKATLVSADAQGADGAQFIWAPGETTVAQRFGGGYRAGLRFFDLRGKTVRAVSGVGEAHTTESFFSPAGKWFTTACPDEISTRCVWDTATGRRGVSFPMPRSYLFIGWFNDAHIMLSDQTKSPQRIVIMNLKGKVVRILADVPANEVNGKPGRSLWHFTKH